MDLTEGEMRFLRAYRRSLDEGAAFAASGLPKKEGQSDRRAGRALLRRLKKKRAELEAREAELERVTPERVKAEIAHIAFDDIGRYLSFREGENGFEVKPADSGLLDTRGIAEVSVGAGGRMSLKLYNKERALYKLYEIARADAGDGEDGSLLDVLRGLGPQEGEDAEDQGVQ